MPISSGFAKSLGRSVGALKVRDAQNFRMTGQQELLSHVDLQITEATAETDLRFRREIELVANNDDAMV